MLEFAPFPDNGNGEKFPPMSSPSQKRIVFLRSALRAALTAGAALVLVGAAVIFLALPASKNVPPAKVAPTKSAPAPSEPADVPAGEIVVVPVEEREALRPRSNGKKPTLSMLRPVKSTKLAFKFNFAVDNANSPEPGTNNAGWSWEYETVTRRVFHDESGESRSEETILRPKISGGVAEFNGAGMCSEEEFFNCDAFACAFEIADVRNLSPAVVFAFSGIHSGEPAFGRPGFFIKVTEDSVFLEAQETRERLVEANGLNLYEKEFKRIAVVNTPRGSSISVNGKVVARSKKFVSGTDENRFGVGIAFRLPQPPVGPRLVGFEKLKAKLKSIALFREPSGTPESSAVASASASGTAFGESSRAAKKSSAPASSSNRSAVAAGIRNAAGTLTDSSAGTPSKSAGTPTSKKIVAKKPVPSVVKTDDSPVDPKRRFIDGSTELHIACANGDVERVGRLLAAGAVPAAVDRISRTPLHRLCQNASSIAPGSFEKIAKMLVNAAPDLLHMRDRAGRAPIHNLCYSGDFDYARPLLALEKRQANIGDREGKTPLFFAVEAGDKDFVSFLLANGADCNIPSQAGVLPLETALANREPEIFGLLVGAGADVGRKNAEGSTPLHYICRFADEFGRENFRHAVAMLRPPALIALSVRDREGCIPVHYLCAAGEFDLAEVLIRREHRQVNVGDGGRRTPLFFAVSAGDLKFTRFLLSVGGDPNIVPSDGNAMLLVAAEKGREDLVGVLLDAGANPNVRNRAGRTPFLLLCAEGKPSETVLSKLIEKGASPKATDKARQNALHIACASGADPASVEFLVALGIDVNARDKEGLTPLDVAEGDCERTLRMFGARHGK